VADPKTCPLCLTPLEPYRPQGPTRSFHLCPSCRWILLDEAHHLSPEAQKARYETHENEAGNEGYVAMFEGFLAQGVDPFAKKGRKALDLGCGPGPVLAGMLHKRGYPTDLHDPFFFPQVNGEEAYGLITATEVLEHLPDPVAALRPWVAKLSPGGILAGMTLFHPDDPAKFASWWYLKDPTHVSFYTERTLGKLARVLGMDLLFTDGKRLFTFRKKPA